MHAISLCACNHMPNVISADVIKQLRSIDKLMQINEKRISRNPLLSKYIYVLREKRLVGNEVSSEVQGLQIKLIQAIAEQRRALDLLPKKMGIVDLSKQNNFKQLEIMCVDRDVENVNYISSQFRI